MALGAGRVEGREAVVVAVGEALRVDGARLSAGVRSPVGVDRGGEVPAVDPRKGRQPELREQRRGHVRARGERRDAAPRRQARTGHEQGNPLGLVVDQVGVGALAVGSEVLAVVGGDHHQGVFEPSAGGDSVEQAADLGVRVGDLALVGIGGVLGAVGLRGLVAGVRIVVVRPEEEGPLALLEPGQRRVGDRLGVALVVAADVRRARRAHLVVVVLEAPFQPVVLRQHHGGDHRARFVALLVETLGQGGDVLGEAEDPVVSDAVPGRRAPGEDRRVGGQGQRGRRDGGLEEHAAGGQRVQGGSRRVLAPVGSHPVRAQCVDGHQQDVRTRGHRARHLDAFAAHRSQQEQEAENGKPAPGDVCCHGLLPIGDRPGGVEEEMYRARVPPRPSPTGNRGAGRSSKPSRAAPRCWPRRSRWAAAPGSPRWAAGESPAPSG